MSPSNQALSFFHFTPFVFQSGVQSADAHSSLYKIHATMSQTQIATVELQDLDTYPHTSVFHDKTSTQKVAGNGSSQTQTSSEEASLPRVDGGKDAWSFLAACWVVEAITFGEILPFSAGIQLVFPKHLLTCEHPGFGFSFGIFQDYYSSHKPFSGSSSIAAIGTTTSVSLT